MGTWYLTPSAEPWQRKLGAGATITSAAPAPKPTTPVLIGDDGDAGYTDLSHDWNPVVESGAFQHDYHLRPAPEEPPSSTEEVASWTFTAVEPGWYHIEATWLNPSEDMAVANYAIYDGETLLGPGPFTAGQQAPPTGDTDTDGRPWQIVTTKYLRHGTLRVALLSQSSGNLVADGIRIVPIENNVQVISVQKSLTGEEVTAHVSVEQIVPH